MCVSFVSVVVAHSKEEEEKLQRISFCNAPCVPQTLWRNARFEAPTRECASRLCLLWWRTQKKKKKNSSEFPFATHHAFLKLFGVSHALKLQLANVRLVCVCCGGAIKRRRRKTPANFLLQRTMRSSNSLAYRTL